jgi:hypothetical protein
MPGLTISRPRAASPKTPAIHDAGAGIPVVQFGGQSGTDGATEWKYVPPHSKNEINPGRSRFLSLQLLSVCISKFLAVGADPYRNQLAFRLRSGATRIFLMPLKYF